MSKKLNLKTHIMEGLEGGSLTWGFPFDFEMHKKGDSLYALDVSRLIPSAVNVGKFEYLYKMFRPELLQKSDEPINPDWAVKSFHKEEDVEAAKRLLARLEGPGEDILPYEFADSLVRLEPIEEYTDDLAFRMHSTGVNLRYLGMVHQRLVDKYPDSKWRCRVAVEIVARSLRKLIMEKQHSRNTQHSSGSDAALVINNLNKLFDVAGDAEMWGAINNDIRNRFVNTTYTFSLDDLRREPAGRPTFMMRITDMLGLVWYNDAWTAFTNTENEKVFFEVENPLFVYSLKDVQPRVKQMNIAYHLNAVFVENGTKSLKERTPLYIHNTIIQSFKSGLERAPSSGITLRRYAKAFDNYVKCLGAQSVSPDAREAHEKKLENMKRKLDAIYSILCSSKEPMSVYYGAVYLDENGKIEEARKYYRASIQSNSGNSFLMLADTYGFTDGELYDPKEAEEIYKRGIDEDKSAKRTLYFKYNI